MAPRAGRGNHSMAKVWLDAGELLDEPPRLPDAAHEACVRAALTCDPAELHFCRFGPEGLRIADAATVRHALDRIPAHAHAPAPPPEGFAGHVRQWIAALPPSMQPPVMAMARSTRRLLDPSSRPSPAAEQASTGTVALQRPPFAAADVFVSFSPHWQAQQWQGLRELRDDLGFQVLLPRSEVPPQELRPLEAWARSRTALAGQGDGVAVLRHAFVMASQGRTSFEDRLQHLYMGVLREGDTCIDIGAHTGRHALPMSCAVGSGRVAAFEPNPAIAQRLRARLANLAAAKVTVHELALSDEAGDAEFVIALERPEESGLKERVYNGPTRLEKVQVKLATLDSLALGEPRFVKLDTEGAEYKVLLGARETLARARPVVAFEFGQQSYGAYGVDPNDVFAYFDSLGYDVMSIHGDKLEQAEFALASTVQSYWDYVACPRTESASVQAILQSFTR